VNTVVPSGAHSVPASDSEAGCHWHPGQSTTAAGSDLPVNRWQAGAEFPTYVPGTRGPLASIHTHHEGTLSCTVEPQLKFRKLPCKTHEKEISGFRANYAGVRKDFTQMPMTKSDNEAPTVESEGPASQVCGSVSHGSGCVGCPLGARQLRRKYASGVSCGESRSHSAR
jgi:hypothetical protein